MKQASREEPAGQKSKFSKHHERKEKRVDGVNLETRKTWAQYTPFCERMELASSQTMGTVPVRPSTLRER